MKTGSCQIWQGPAALFRNVGLQPCFNFGHIKLTLRDGKTEVNQFILCIRERNSISAHDHQHGCNADAFVTVDKTVVLCQSAANGGSLADQAGMSFYAAEGCSGTRKCAVDQSKIPKAVGTAGQSDQSFMDQNHLIQCRSQMLILPAPSEQEGFQR